VDWIQTEANAGGICWNHDLEDHRHLDLVVAETRLAPISHGPFAIA
jgi:hypothetical protein